MMRLLPFIGIAVAVIVFIVSMTFFRVDERQQALVLQFGQVKEVITDPGLAWKVPLIQDVVYYEDRILPLETSPLEVTPADERRLVVDAFARWRIVDVVKFRQSVQTEVNATQRLENILNAELRQVLGQVQSSDVLSPERTVLMSRIRDSAREKAEDLGVEIIDVRIRRADLPEQNLQATFERMNAERQREAADERARGEERAQEVRATADREATELVSDAQRQAEVIRGEADAERNNIYASAYGRDQEFFAFYRSLSAYERALQGGNSTMVITPDSEFFDYLKTDRGQFAPRPSPGAAAPADDGSAALPSAGETPAGTAEDGAAEDVAEGTTDEVEAGLEAEAAEPEAGEPEAAEAGESGGTEPVELEVEVQQAEPADPEADQGDAGAEDGAEGTASAVPVETTTGETQN